MGKEYPTKQPAFGPLSLYNQQFRTLIGKELANSANVCSLGPYIPPFYWTGVTNTSNIFTRVRIYMRPSISESPQIGCAAIVLLNATEP